MFKKIILFLLFSTLIPSTKLLVLFPEADLPSNAEVSIKDVENIYYSLINQFENNKSVSLIEHKERHFCYSKECAINLMNNYNADEAVTSKIRILNSEIVLTGMILYENGEKEFTVRSTAASLKQLESSIPDLVESLIDKNNKMKIPNVKGMIDKKGEQVKNSFFQFQNILKSDKEYRVGIGHSSYAVHGQGYKLAEYNGGGDMVGHFTPQVRKIRFINSWHFDNSKFFTLNFFLNHTPNGNVAMEKDLKGYGFELISNTYLSISSIGSTPKYPIFYGLGVGWQFIGGNRSEGSGIFFLTQIGYNAFKTSPINLLVTLKYQADFMFDMEYMDDGTSVPLFNQGLSFNLALISKIASKKDN